MKKNSMIPIKIFQKIVSVILVGIILNCIAPQAFADDDSVKEAGDILQILLPALAGGSTFFAGNPEGGMWDKEGTIQFAKSFGTTMAVTHLWKELAHKMRPDESDRKSFPSGHTASAFSGAAFIGSRYGWMWGIPAYAGAVFTGYSRVDADEHYANDVVAGASVGMLSNWLFVTPQSDSFSVAPIVKDDGAGLQMTVSEGAFDKKSKTNDDPNFVPRFRYEFIFGPAYLIENTIQASSNGGTEFDLNDFNKDEDPVTTASVDFSWYINERNSLVFDFIPYEARDNGRFTNPVKFGNALFPADTDVRAAWRSYDVRLQWEYDLLPANPLGVRVGAGAMYQNIKVELGTRDGSMLEEVDSNVILPVVSATLTYHFTPSFSIGMFGEGTYIGDHSMIEGIASLTYRITNHWDVSAGYTYYYREIDDDDLRNKAVYHAPMLAIAYSF